MACVVVNGLVKGLKCCTIFISVLTGGFVHDCIHDICICVCICIVFFL